MARVWGRVSRRPPRMRELCSTLSGLARCGRSPGQPCPTFLDRLPARWSTDRAKPESAITFMRPTITSFLSWHATAEIRRPCVRVRRIQNEGAPRKAQGNSPCVTGWNSGPWRAPRCLAPAFPARTRSRGRTCRFRRLRVCNWGRRGGGCICSWGRS